MKQKAYPNYHVKSSVSPILGGRGVVSRNQDSCRPLSPEVATSPFQLSAFPLVNFIQLSIMAHLPSARPVKTGSSPSNVRMLMLLRYIPHWSVGFARAAHEEKGEHQGSPPSLPHTPTNISEYLALCQSLR